MTLRDIYRRLDALEKDLNDGVIPGGANPDIEEGDDEFTYYKKKIHKDIKAIREMLDERDELQSKRKGEKDAVIKTAECRKALRAVNLDFDKIKGVQRIEKEKSRKKKSKISAEELETRDETIKLIEDHIDECERLEKRRGKEEGQGRSNDLFEGISLDTFTANKSYTGGGQGPSSATMGDGPATKTNLPDIDISNEMKQIDQRKAAQDQVVEQIGQDLQEIKQMATAMNDELDVQRKMAEEIEDDVDKVTAKLENVNDKLKKALTSVRSSNRFIIDIILVFVILGILGYAAKMITRDM